MNKNKKKVWLCLGLSLLMGLSCGLCACDNDNPDEGNGGGGGGDPIIVSPPNNDGPKYEPLTSITYRNDFTPTRFKGETAKYEITQLGTGVCVIKNTVTRADGKVSTVYAIDVDLNFANIVAGTKNNETTNFYTANKENNRKAAPYAMAQAWELAHQGGHVYSSLNADFFGGYNRGGGYEVSPINAFVKDGVIITDSHVDKGNYDYKTAVNDESKGLPNSDLPASAPMLFGIKGNTAQIAPIIPYEGDPADPVVKEQLVKAKLSYGLTELTVNGVSCPFVLNQKAPEDKGVSVITKGGTYDYGLNTLAIKLDATNFKAGDPGSYELNVLDAELKTKTGRLTVEDGEVYILAKKLSETFKSVENVKAGDKVKCEVGVTSPDGTWNGYTTILGTRQALVIDSEVPETITKENTNGAQSQNIPRSAVGIMPNGHVVIFAVEDLHYYGTSKSEDDTYGMNLPTLAEFMKFYGVKMGGNFDGGGSTQLVMRGENEETPKVYIRAADTAYKDNNTNVLKTRPVINAILVTNKVED